MRVASSIRRACFSSCIISISSASVSAPCLPLAFMYEGFYSLTATPFTRGIPEDRFFLPPKLSEVLSRLEFVSERHLFAVLTGDCGTGKTTVLRRLSSRLDSRKYRMLYVSDSRLTPHSFYRTVLEQLGMVADWNSSKAKRQLHEQLSIMQAVDGINTVCVVDESHLLSFEMLEEVRFLMNEYLLYVVFYPL